MSTAFGIFLFVLVYGAVAYLIYDDVTGGLSRPRVHLARRARPTAQTDAASRATTSTGPVRTLAAPTSR